MTEFVLSAEEHFESLREPVWRRFRARHGLFCRDRFEDAYSEWWTREVERAACGRPSRVETPTAFVAEAVHRVLIDEGRARARGLARGSEKAALELVDLDDQRHLAAADATAAQAAYEALAHRVLELVRDRLRPRELQVFVWTYLYLRSTPETAAGLGLSEPRVKKDRKRVAAKVGEEVWQLLGGELELCPAYDDKRLQAVFEVLVTHAEDCPECSRGVTGLRAGALAVTGPLEVLALAVPGEAPLADLVDGIAVRASGLLHRSVETAAALPPGGRVAAAVVAGAAALAGGSVVVIGGGAQPKTAPPTVTRPAPAATAAPVSEPVAPAATSGAERTRRHARRKRRRVAPSAAGAATPVPSSTATRTAPSVATAPSARDTPPGGSAPASPGEFGFERP